MSQLVFCLMAIPRRMRAFARFVSTAMRARPCEVGGKNTINYEP